MKRYLCAAAIFAITLTAASGFAQAVKQAQTKVILMISEQNIDGPRSAWWASEVDLSSTESSIARKLIEQGFEIIDPSSLSGFVKSNKAYRVLDITDQSSAKLGKNAQADYVIVGKAVASAGGLVPESNMKSCFANITVKVINCKTGKIVSYLDGTGSSVHTDVITGGKEALVKAADSVALKICEALKQNVVVN